MNPRAPQIMREALERISAIQKPKNAPAEQYDLEDLRTQNVPETFLMRFKSLVAAQRPSG